MTTKRAVAVKFIIYLILALVVILASAIFYSKVAEANIKTGESMRDIIDNTINNYE